MRQTFSLENFSEIQLFQKNQKLFSLQTRTNTARVLCIQLCVETYISHLDFYLYKIIPSQSSSFALLTYQINHFSHKIIKKKKRTKFPRSRLVRTSYYIQNISHFITSCCTYNLFVPKKKSYHQLQMCSWGFCVRNAMQTNSYCIIWGGGSIAIMLTRKCIY